MRIRYPVSGRTLFAYVAVGWVALLFLAPLIIGGWVKLGLSAPAHLPGLN